MNPPSDGHDSGRKSDANPEALIVGTIFADLCISTFIKVRGRFSRAVEIISLVDDAAMEVTTKSNISDQTGVGIDWQVQFAIALAACVCSEGGDPLRTRTEQPALRAR